MHFVKHILALAGVAALALAAKAAVVDELVYHDLRTFPS